MREVEGPRTVRVAVDSILLDEREHQARAMAQRPVQRLAGRLAHIRATTSSGRSHTPALTIPELRPEPP